MRVALSVNARQAFCATSRAASCMRVCTPTLCSGVLTPDPAGDVGAVPPTGARHPTSSSASIPASNSGCQCCPVRSAPRATLLAARPVHTAGALLHRRRHGWTRRVLRRSVDAFSPTDCRHGSPSARVQRRPPKSRRRNALPAPGPAAQTATAALVAHVGRRALVGSLDAAHCRTLSASQRRASACRAARVVISIMSASIMNTTD